MSPPCSVSLKMKTPLPVSLWSMYIHTHKPPSEHSNQTVCGGAWWSPMVDTRSEEVTFNNLQTVTSLMSGVIIKLSITDQMINNCSCVLFSPSDSCELTININTVNRRIKLSDNNRKVTHVEEDQSYPDHPDRFDPWPQLLCSTGLTGRCYWEVECRGRVFISLSYRGIRRKGNSKDCEFGRNDQSWSLNCSAVGYSVCHNDRETSISSSSSSSSSVSNRVAVYVDCPAGSLSFYRVSSNKLIHLHTFNTTFTEPLYPGFGVWFNPGSSVSLC
uniref:B30.2/SPRY domain-containing protein n=1 Tax=Seriola lalandi dorsalis TaxID=1841481 RepID=A0A3B4XG07_SERLL